MDCQTIQIVQVIRRMRGSSQAQLVRGHDGRLYVGKFQGNPQGNRTLVNEWIAAKLYQKLAVSTPPLVLLKLGEKVGQSDDFCFRLGDKKIAIEAGIHLGSVCPVDPSITAIFDFLPTSLLHRIGNLDEFAIALVLDTLLGQTDSRQAILTREHPGIESPFRAHFIDHGMAFNGTAWSFGNGISHGLYHNRGVYSLLDSTSICEKTCDALVVIDEDLLFETLENIPDAWFAPGDSGALAKLFAQLIKRREQVSVFVREKLEDVRRRDKCRFKSRHPKGLTYSATFARPLLSSKLLCDTGKNYLR